jgi:hypothetical protein
MQVEIGKWDVVSDIVITDPLYDINNLGETQLCQTIKNVVQGEWNSYSIIDNIGTWGDRTTEVVTYCGRPPTFDLKWEVIPDACTVDSASLGFFSVDNYPNDYELTTYFTCNCNNSGVIELDLSDDEESSKEILRLGFVSGSGFGDGLYDIYTHKNDNGLVNVIKVVFIDLEKK